MIAGALAALTFVALVAARRGVDTRRRRRLVARLQPHPAAAEVLTDATARVTGSIARRRSAMRIEHDLPLALESMARGLRSGASLRTAIAEASLVVGGVLGDDLGRVVRRVEHGASLADSLEEWTAERPLSGVRLAAAALALGAETGGTQARAVDGVAATLRERIAAAAEVRAQATQARLSAGVIAVAPLAFGALATATDARTAAFLLRTPLGLVLLAAGVGLDALGALWMNRLTRI